MTERRKLTLRDKLLIVIAQARCPICNEKLGDIAGLDFDHERALVNGGEDTLDNMRAVHRADCHKKKTHGNGATNRGSDRGEAIKSARMEEKRKERELAAANLIEPNSDIESNSGIAKSGKSVNRKPKRKLEGRSSWPPKKPKVPYRRRGV